MLLSKSISVVTFMGALLFPFSCSFILICKKLQLRYCNMCVLNGFSYSSFYFTICFMVKIYKYMNHSCLWFFPHGKKKKGS